jgi:hypothetical protein
LRQNLRNAGVDRRHSEGKEKDVQEVFHVLKPGLCFPYKDMQAE